jgi:hypothetical protein
MVQAPCEIVHKPLRKFGITSAYEPIADQLRIGTDRGLGPDIAGKGRGALGSGGVLFLGVAERPDFIALNALAI